MKRLTILLILIVGFTHALDCPADSAFHTDNRTLLPDGTPNPNFGQVIATGLCACLGFEATLSGMPEDSTVTLIVKIVDNEPIRGIQMDVYHDAGLLLHHGPEPYEDSNGNGSYDDGETYTDLDGNGEWTSLAFGSIHKGEKLENVFDENGDPETSSNAIQLLSNQINDYVKVMAYSTNRTQTAGDSEEGFLFTLTYKTPNGHESLPATITFYFENVKLPGTSMAPDLLDVTCSYPDVSNAITFNTSEMGIDDDALPTVFSLAQNYPNPFNPTTRIAFDLPEQSLAKLVVYNLLGQQVNVLTNRHLNAGHHVLDWNGLDASGNIVASGVYFYELRAGDFVAKKKMLLLR